MFKASDEAYRRLALPLGAPNFGAEAAVRQTHFGTESVYSPPRLFTTQNSSTVELRNIAVPKLRFDDSTTPAYNILLSRTASPKLTPFSHDVACVNLT